MEIDWGGVKTEYEEGVESIRGLAKRHGLHHSSVCRKAEKEGWIRRVTDDAEHVPDDSPLCNDGESDDANLIRGHRKLWKKVKKRLEKGLKKKDVKTGLEELKVAKVAGEVLTNVIKGERLAWGLNDDGGGEPCEADAVAVEMAQVTASCGADEDVDRE